MILDIGSLILYSNNIDQLIKYFMCKSPITLKKNINRRETLVSCLYNSAFTTKKDIEKATLPNKLTEEKPP